MIFFVTFRLCVRSGVAEMNDTVATLRSNMGILDRLKILKMR